MIMVLTLILDAIYHLVSVAIGPQWQVYIYFLSELIPKQVISSLGPVLLYWWKNYLKVGFDVFSILEKLLCS